MRRRAWLMNIGVLPRRCRPFSLTDIIQRQKKTAVFVVFTTELHGAPHSGYFGASNPAGVSLRFLF